MKYYDYVIVSLMFFVPMWLLLEFFKLLNGQG